MTRVRGCVECSSLVSFSTSFEPYRIPFSNNGDLLKEFMYFSSKLGSFKENYQELPALRTGTELAPAPQILCPFVTDLVLFAIDLAIRVMLCDVSRVPETMASFQKTIPSGTDYQARLDAYNAFRDQLEQRRVELEEQ